VERAREEAEFARRQFFLVRPEHRLVADSLEREWNEKLARLAEREEEYGPRQRRRSPPRSVPKPVRASRARRRRAARVA